MNVASQPAALDLVERQGCRTPGSSHLAAKRFHRASRGPAVVVVDDATPVELAHTGERGTPCLTGLDIGNAELVIPGRVSVPGMTVLAQSLLCDMRAAAGTASQLTLGFQSANMPAGLSRHTHAWSPQSWKSSFWRKSRPNNVGAGPSLGASV